MTLVATLVVRLLSLFFADDDLIKSMDDLEALRNILIEFKCKAGISELNRFLGVNIGEHTSLERTTEILQPSQ